jgi:transposase-like protein
MAEVMRLIINEAMKIERNEVLNDYDFERTTERKGYANGFKNKTINTRFGQTLLDVPQVRGGIDFYPDAIEKGLKTERSINLAISEMYIQGVSTRKVESLDFMRAQGALVNP